MSSSDTKGPTNSLSIPENVSASVNQQTIPDQTIVSTTSQVNKDSSPVHYQTMVWWDFFFSLRLKTLTCIISTLFLSFIRPWLPHQTINTFKNKSTCLFSSIRPWQPHQTINTNYQESTHFFSSIRPWSDGLFLQFKGENTDLYHFNSISMLHQTMAAPSDH